MKIYQIWDDLIKEFGNGSINQTSKLHINEEAEKYLTVFLAEGYDATKLAKMLSNYNVFRYFDALKKHGAEIDLADRFKDDPQFVYDNLDTFRHYGVPIDDIAKIVTRSEAHCNGLHALTVLAESGANPRILLEALEKSDLTRSKDFEHGNQLREFLTKLVNKGCNRSVITTWLKGIPLRYNKKFIADAVQFHYVDWSYCMDPLEFIDEWVGMYAREYLCGHLAVELLPDLVPIQTLVEHLSIVEIIAHTDGDPIPFLEDYKRLGGDMAVLRKKVEKEIDVAITDTEKDIYEFLEENDKKPENHPQEN